MVYVALDDECKSKGKAAVDVLGLQFGKTGGSFMQQGLLFWFGSIYRGVTSHGFSLTIALAWLAAVHAAGEERRSLTLKSKAI